MFGMVNPKYKTMMCRHYEQTGTCQLGAKCHFAHGKEELRKITDPLPTNVVADQKPMSSMGGGQGYSGGSTMGSNPTPSNYKTIKCKYFEQGYCKYNQSCSFAHGDTDIRAPTDNSSMPSMPYSMPSMTSMSTPLQDQSAQNAIAQQQIQYLITQMEQFHASNPQFLFSIKSAKELNNVGNMQAAASAVYEIINRTDKSKEEAEKYNEFLQNIQNLGQTLYTQKNMQYMQSMPMYGGTQMGGPQDYSGYSDPSQYKMPYYGMPSYGYGGGQGMGGGMGVGMQMSSGSGQGKGSIGKS